MYRGSLDLNTFNNCLEIRKQDCIYNLENILNTKTLKNYQTISVGLGIMSERLLLGDDMGLGKTAQVGGILRGLDVKYNKPNRGLYITKGNAIYQTASELYEDTGKVYLPVFGGKDRIERTLSNFNYKEYDGIITSHDSINKGMSFHNHFSGMIKDFDIGIFDESFALANNTSLLHNITKSMFNKLRSRYLLSGTAVSNNIMQIANQLRILDDTLLPSINKINSQYGVYGKYNFITKRKELTGYVDNVNFVHNIPAHYIGRSRKDVNIAFDREYNVHICHPTVDMMARVNSSNYKEVLYNPVSFETNLNQTTVPALGVVIKRVKDLVAEHKPVVIYVFNIAIKYAMKHCLEDALKMEVGIIDGQQSKEDNEISRLKFEKGELDILITNTTESINLGRSNHILAYDIPSDYLQLIGRLERGIVSSTTHIEPIVYYEPNYINNLYRMYRNEKIASNILKKDIDVLHNIVNKLQHEITLKATFGELEE